MSAWDERNKLREEHYERFFGPVSQPVVHGAGGGDPHIDTYQFPPIGERNHWTLITSGMSDKRQKIPEDIKALAAPRAELFLYARKPESWMLDALEGLAVSPFKDALFLHWWHTVPNDRALAASASRLTAFLLLAPYFEPDEFDTFEIENDPVDFLWVVPITEDELAYARKNGSEALLDTMRANGLDPVIDENRDSLV